ncbi:MAG: hypothetical protein AAF493_05455 [Pseudomonadota bacterium]
MNQLSNHLIARVRFLCLCVLLAIASNAPATLVEPEAASLGLVPYFSIDAIPAFKDSIDNPEQLFVEKRTVAPGVKSTDSTSVHQPSLQTDLLLAQVEQTWGDVRSSLAGSVSRFLALDPIVTIREALRADDLSTFTPVTRERLSDPSAGDPLINLKRWRGEGRSVESELTLEELLYEMVTDIFSSPWPYLVIGFIVVLRVWLAFGHRGTQDAASKPPEDEASRPKSSRRKRRRRRRGSSSESEPRMAEPMTPRSRRRRSHRPRTV